MEALTATAAPRFSLRTFPGSMLLATAIHGAIYLAVVLLMAHGWVSAERPTVDAELGYEVLDAPPAPAEKPARVLRRAEPEVPKEKTIAKDTSTKELQDEKSDVIGTQKASAQRADIGGSADGDANATPFYKIKPKYPRPALVAGLEGWVLLRIDVNEKGEVENVRAIGGEKRNLFESEARRAVEQWKYRPFLDKSGNPVRKADHQVRVDFKLSDT
jgi:protein TonB